VGRGLAEAAGGVARAVGDRCAGGAQSVCGAGGLLNLMTRNRASNGKVLGRPTALQVAVDLLDFKLEAPLEDKQGEQSKGHLFNMGEGGRIYKRNHPHCLRSHTSPKGAARQP